MVVLLVPCMQHICIASTSVTKSSLGHCWLPWRGNDIDISPRGTTTHNVRHCLMGTLTMIKNTCHRVNFGHVLTFTLYQNAVGAKELLVTLSKRITPTLSENPGETNVLLLQVVASNTFTNMPVSPCSWVSLLYIHDFVWSNSMHTGHIDDVKAICNTP